VTDRPSPLEGAMPRSSDAGERLAAAEVAIGNTRADLALVGGEIVDVHTGERRRADIAVSGRRIACVGDIEGRVESETEVVDVSGLVLLPGFIDPHLHIGGSQLEIRRLAEILVPAGTTAIATDFYEMGTIAGAAAVYELLDRSPGTGLAVLFSPFYACALGFGQWGDLGRLSPAELAQMVEDPRAVELREWNYGISQIGIPDLDRAYETAIDRSVTLSGHLEGLGGSVLQASVALGVRNDHETVTAEEAVERARLGLIVQIREGSGAQNLVPVIPALTDHGMECSSFSFCTDEQELASLVRDGHIDHKIRLAVQHGIPPIDAVRMATVNAARSMGVDGELGSIAPGKIASVTATRDLERFEVALVMSEGTISARDGSYLLRPGNEPYPDEWRTTVRFERTLSPDDFVFDRDLSRARVRVIGVAPGSLVTEELIEDVIFSEGRVEAPGEDLACIAMFDRHLGGRHDTMALVRGLGIRRGAIATTINPGLMNLMVIGADEADMATAANRVVAMQGGICVVKDGGIRAEVATPLFGIVSDAPADEVASACERVADAITLDLGSSVGGLITQAGFACLAVSIPRLKLADRGLIRVSREGGQEAVDFVVGDEAR
jgi:adenine deaminase